MKKSAPFLLAILDGLALNPDPRGNAVLNAKTPTLDALMRDYPMTTLTSHSERVGLPDGQMGNSEVGHLNIGAGRVVEQDLTRIDKAVRLGKLRENEQFHELCSELRTKPDAALHLVGLVSEGGVHSQLSHIKALAKAALENGVNTVFVHAITDGRDRPPNAAEVELLELERYFTQELRQDFPEQYIGIPSVVGRYYAMDRDHRWERTKLAYDLFVDGSGTFYPSIEEALFTRRALGETDEFLHACVVEDVNAPRQAIMKDGDGLMFFNFRADRMKQIVRAFYSGPEFDGFKRDRTVSFRRIATLTAYDEDYPVSVMFAPNTIKNHLGAVISKAGLRQLRIAETEKYAHVTYFFSGGDEQPAPGEERILVPSPRDVPTYDLKPEMSAREVTNKLLEVIKNNSADVIILNFANCDMVGHTGNYDAAVKAVETVDYCLGLILAALLEAGGSALVTADHGNADQMIDYETDGPHTFHTLHPVPCILVGPAAGDEKSLASGGALCDIAPTILDCIGLAIPDEMTGRSLIISNRHSIRAEPVAQGIQ